ncbi:hypothetical protein CDD83_267 [Cordyceps sp. RAO-2017]|nr:hypothetical protein CDD83_267 [Cordyceps sp. RAO-2017]
MQLTTTLLACVMAASSALAAPAAAAEVSMMAAKPQWTIVETKRVCDKTDSKCTWTFGINTHQDKVPVTACKHVVKGDKDVKASRVNGSPPSNCGDFTITSGWSGQFGEGKGFTTLSVVNNKENLIVWAGYTDNQVKEGKVVKPDQSYAPVKIEN